jgi:fatty-acyl-CoA synthase
MNMARPNGKTLAEVVGALGKMSPGKTAIYYQDEIWSYGELLGRTEMVAKSLLAMGVRNGDRVGALLGNEPDWVVISLAVAMVGATFVPLNTWYKQQELAWTVRHCGLSLLITRDRYIKTSYLDLFSAMMPELASSVPGRLRAPQWPNLHTLVFIGDCPPGAMTWHEFVKAGDAVSADCLDTARAAVLPDTAAYVLYTSGSTAEPKGVLLNHRGVVENGFDLGQQRDINSDDRVWLGTPLFYALGATNALPAALTAGAALVLQGSFDPGQAIATIEKHEATVYYGAGNMARSIVDHPEFSRSRIGSLSKGNAGLGAEYKRLTLQEMGIARAVPAYGLTETYGNAAVGRPDDPLEIKLTTDGYPLPGMEILIVDPLTSVPLPKGRNGLILIRGYTTPGYYNNPAETSKVIRDDGFFDTGDIGRFDDGGRLIFVSRFKDVIKSSGINISPVEVEQLLASHPDVREAHVVGVPNATRGEVIVAFVNATTRLSEDALCSYVKDRAASFKVPHHIFFRSDEQLPRLASGKIAKYRLVEEARRELGA